MNKLILLALISFCSYSLAHPPIDCSGSENQRESIIELKGFDCESETNCALALWSPSTLEERPFIGFDVVLNQTAPEVYDLAFSLSHQNIKNQVVGYLYGTLKSLEQTQVNASYWVKGMGCPLQSSIHLKHNKGNH